MKIEINGYVYHWECIIKWVLRYGLWYSFVKTSAPCRACGKD